MVLVNVLSKDDRNKLIYQKMMKYGKVHMWFVICLNFKLKTLFIMTTWKYPLKSSSHNCIFRSKLSRRKQSVRIWVEHPPLHRMPFCIHLVLVGGPGVALDALPPPQICLSCFTHCYTATLSFDDFVYCLCSMRIPWIRLSRISLHSPFLGFGFGCVQLLEKEYYDYPHRQCMNLPGGVGCLDV